MKKVFAWLFLCVVALLYIGFIGEQFLKVYDEGGIKQVGSAFIFIVIALCVLRCLIGLVGWALDNK